MKNIIAIFSLFSVLCSCAQSSNQTESINKNETDTLPHKLVINVPDSLKKAQVAYFGSGCFWCSEAIFQEVKGVREVFSGYSGGKIPKPTYQMVCTGNTGHAEMLQIFYDSTIVSYQELLEVFFASHDPATLNQQGNDRGTQYRSIILYQTLEERMLAKNYIQELLDNKTFEAITTEVVPIKDFYIAEDYHQDFDKKNPNNGYVQAVSFPRLEKFKNKRPDLLKKN